MDPICVQPVHVPLGSRRAIRRGVSLSCEVVCARFDQPLLHQATDLSPEGIWLQTGDPLRAGEQVVVCFEPNEGWMGGELMVFAEVARVTTSRRRRPEPGIGMGLEFLDLGSDERDMLTAWLAARRSPVPRRQRPVRRFVVGPHAMQLAVDGVISDPAPVHVPQIGEDDTPVAPRVLAVCWR